MNSELAIYVYMIYCIKGHHDCLKKIGAMEVASITGHGNPKQLEQYIPINPESLVARMG